VARPDDGPWRKKSNLESRLEARRARRASKAARTARTLHVAGGVLIVGNATEVFETFPYAGGALVALGGFVFWLASPEAQQT
jgi:hypothetical protein